MDQRDVGGVSGERAPIEAILGDAVRLATAVSGVDAAVPSIGCVVLRVHRSNLLSVMRTLKTDPHLDCRLLVDITIVDWMDKSPEVAGSERFEVVYHVYSLTRTHRFRVKVAVPENDPSIDSVCSVWQGANFMEREAWDMYGVTFKGHPDLRRILMYDEFQGYPLRKDYPVQGKQPRIPLRSPEVRNTALDLKRGELVQIKGRITR